MSIEDFYNNRIYKELESLHKNNLITKQELEDYKNKRTLEDMQAYLVELCSYDEQICDEIYDYIVELDLELNEKEEH